MLALKRALFCVVGFFALLGAAHAETVVPLPSPVIAIIDVQRILQESLASKSVQKQLEAQRSTFQNEIEKEENGLRQAEQTLSQQRTKLSAQEYADREQQLKQRFLTVENHVQKRRKVLDQSYAEAMAAVRAALVDIVSSLARERGANLVIVKQQALWTDLPLDITDDVLKRFDQKMPKIDIAVPSEKPDK